MDNFYVGGKEDLPIEANWWVYKHPSRSWRKTEVALYTLRFYLITSQKLQRIVPRPTLNITNKTDLW